MKVIKGGLYKCIIILLVIEIVFCISNNTVEIKDSFNYIDYSLQFGSQLAIINIPSAEDVNVEPVAVVPNSENTVDVTKTSNSEKFSNIKEHEGFVLLKDLDSSLLFDIRYATTNNFTNTIVYSNDICVLRTETAYKVVAANQILKIQGYCLKIYDAYRPLSVQKRFWEIMPDSNYVANPYTDGSIHNKGCAVDITMININTGKEVEMPSEFDDFTEKACRTSNMTSNARNNLEILTSAMTKSGMTTINSEWWHFEDINKSRYSISDIDLTVFK